MIGFAEMAGEKLRIARALAPLSTAVLLDPLHGGHILSHDAVPGAVGLIMCLEEFGYEGAAEGRLTATIPDWSVAKIKRMGAVGVKVLLFYHPDAPVAAQQEAFVARVAEDCRATTSHSSSSRCRIPSGPASRRRAPSSRGRRRPS